MTGFRAEVEEINDGFLVTDNLDGKHFASSIQQVGDIIKECWRAFNGLSEKEKQ